MTPGAAARTPTLVREGSRARANAFVVACLALAFALRAIGLSHAPLSSDEQRTLGIAPLPLGDILRFSKTTHPPLYPLLAHVALGSSPAHDSAAQADWLWLVRVPALIGGLLLCWAIYDSLNSLGSRAVARTALALSACS